VQPALKYIIISIVEQRGVFVLDANYRRPAGFWIRFLASITDNLVLLAPDFLLGLLLTNNNIQKIASLIVTLLYHIMLPIYWNGATVGKKAFGIRIAEINREGSPGWRTMLMRLVGGLIYLITLGIGLIISAFMVAFRQDKRAIHDIIAGTHVIYDNKRR
jgi:uncharacterized RDD family membrane protein YckC